MKIIYTFIPLSRGVYKIKASLKALLLLTLLWSMGCIIAYAQTQDDMGTGGDAGNVLENAALIEVSEGNGYVYGVLDWYDY